VPVVEDRGAVWGMHPGKMGVMGIALLEGVVVVVLVVVVQVLEHLVVAGEHVLVLVPPVVATQAVDILVVAKVVRLREVVAVAVGGILTVGMARVILVNLVAPVRSTVGVVVVVEVLFVGMLLVIMARLVLLAAVTVGLAVLRWRRRLFII